MSGLRPRPLKREPRPCTECGVDCTNYCNRCKRPYCPGHLIFGGRGLGWFCEECEAQQAAEAVEEEQYSE